MQLGCNVLLLLHLNCTAVYMVIRLTWDCSDSECNVLKLNTAVHNNFTMHTISVIKSLVTQNNIAQYTLVEQYTLDTAKCKLIM